MSDVKGIFQFTNNLIAIDNSKKVGTYFENFKKHTVQENLKMACAENLQEDVLSLLHTLCTSFIKV